MYTAVFAAHPVPPPHTAPNPEYVLSPSAPVPSGRSDGQVYPRLRRNQALREEVLAMGHRLAAHPGVQNAIMDDLAVGST